MMMVSQADWTTHREHSAGCWDARKPFAISLSSPTMDILNGPASRTQIFRNLNQKYLFTLIYTRSAFRRSARERSLSMQRKVSLENSRRCTKRV